MVDQIGTEDQEGFKSEERRLSQSLTSRIRDAFREREHVPPSEPATKFPSLETSLLDDDSFDRDGPEILLFPSQSASGRESVVKVVAAANLLTPLPFDEA